MAEEQLESPAVRTRAVLLVVAGILASLVTVAFGLEIFFQNRIGVTTVVQRPLPAPGVRPDERAQRLALEREQNSELNGKGGRLPIEKAMEAIAARGPHAFDPVGVGQ